jgi:hypothetical protein
MKMPIQLKLSTDKALSSEIKSINADELESFDHYSACFWLINVEDKANAISLLTQIRRSSEPRIYLKPVVFAYGGNIEAGILDSADANIAYSSINIAQLETLASELESCNQWIEHLLLKGVTTDSNLTVKVLRFITSRNLPLMPIMTSRHNNGFIYPKLQPMFTKQDTTAVELLSYLNKQQLLTTKLENKAHFCNHCDSAFLNFKEACPDCGSDNLDVNDLIHHFVCANVSEIDDYRRDDDDLVCPKCDKKLKHIGVDYDKPSVVVRCNECLHRFQDAHVITQCYNCERTSEPKNLALKKIYSYTVSALGQNAALYGLESILTNILDKELMLHSISEFSKFLKVESARIARYERSESILVIISISNLDKIYIKLGNKSVEIFTELCRVFKAIFRDSDVICARNESIFTVLMTDTSVLGGETAMKRLVEAIETLLTQNIDIELKTTHQIHSVTPEIELEELVSSVL